MAAPPPPLTVLDGIVACGISNVVQAARTSPAARIALQFFNNDFQVALTTTDKDIDSMCKTFFDLTQAQGQVRLMPGSIRLIKAFTQHICHLIRMDLDPSEPGNGFSPANMAMYVRQRVIQVKFTSNDNKTIIDGAKPSLFTKTTVWTEWNRSLYNYFKLIPSTRGIPLCYIIRPNDDADRSAQTLFQDQYILVAPLAGEDYNQDNARAFILLKALISGNAQAEAILNVHERLQDCRSAHRALRVKYEGVGITAISRTQAEHNISSMFYSGEKINFTNNTSHFFSN